MFASLCRIVGAITGRSGKAAAERLPGLENGELLCEALEAFREWRPVSELEFEHAVLLTSSVVQAENLSLIHCSDCRAATLIDGSRKLYANCGHCQKPATVSPSTRQEADEGMVGDRE